MGSSDSLFQVPTNACGAGAQFHDRQCHLLPSLPQVHEKWEKEQTAFSMRRDAELAEFVEKRAKDAQAFESHQRRQLEHIRGQLVALGETYDAPGKPLKKGSRFGWG